MTRIDRKHFILQINTKNITRVPPLEKLLARKVMKPSKTAVKTADRMDHFKRHCNAFRQEDSGHFGSMLTFEVSVEHVGVVSL